MKKTFLIILLILSFPCLAFGQIIPKITVEAPEQVDREEDLFQIQVVVDNEKDLKDVKFKYVWSVTEDGKPRKTVLKLEQGKSIIVPTKNTQILTYSVMATYVYEVKEPLKVLDKDGKVIEGARVFVGTSKTPLKDLTVDTKDIQSNQVDGKIEIVGGVVPPPPEPPSPKPPAPPVPPDPSKFGFAKMAYDIAISFVAMPERAKALDLASSFDNVAARISVSQSKIAAGVKLSPEDIALDDSSILNAIKTSNGKVLGGNVGTWANWNSEFIKNIVYDRFYDKGLIATPNDWMIAFKEIANGLRQVKNGHN